MTAILSPSILNLQYTLLFCQIKRYGVALLCKILPFGSKPKIYSRFFDPLTMAVGNMSFLNVTFRNKGYICMIFKILPDKISN